jgi:hypothetical protein
MPSIEGSDPATADGEEARSWGQVPLQRILIGGPPTTTDDLRDLIEPSLRVLTVGRCDHRLKPPSPSRSDTARGMTHWRRLRDWNDARCSTNSTNCRSLAAAPTEPAWFGWVHVLQLGHEVPYRGGPVPRRVPGAATAKRPGTAAEAGRGPPSERRSYRSPGDVSPKGSRERGRVCDAPRGLPDIDPVDLSAPPGIDASGTQTSPGLFRSSSPHGCLLAHPTAWLTPHLEAPLHRHGRHCEEADARLAGTF